MNIFKNKNNLIIGVLLAIVFVMAIGFAGFAQQLQISDTASSTNTWNVYISNAELASNSPKATGSVTKAEGLEATFVTTLHSPGDTVVYNVTVTNEGSVDATLDELNLSTTNNDSVIKYSSSGIAKGDTLAQSESKTFTVTVEYDSTKTGTATEAQKSNSATLQLNFVQKTAGGSGNSGGSSAASMLAAKAVTTGDGLYADPVEANRYVYKGAAPANYITFNGEEAGWRIISVEADGTLKIVRNSIIDSMAWDASGNRTASGYCEGTFCNAWGSSTTTLDSSGNNVTVMPREAGSTTTYALPTNEASLNTYLNGAYLNGIGSEYQDVIETHTFNIGPLADNNSSLATDISQESAYKWRGKVGLISATDYVRASSNSNCTGVYAYENTSSCYNNSATHNYLFAALGSNLPWTMSPYSGSSRNAFVVNSDGDIRYDFVYTSDYGVAPVLYVKSDITLTGSGSSGDPYEIG